MTLGVDYALLGGLLAWFMGYIPSIGFMIALIPPVIMAYAQYGLQTAVIVLIGYILINGGVQNFIQPKMMGQGLKINPLVVFVGLFVWGFLLGGMGAILATPLTVLVLTLMENFDGHADAAVLMRYTGEDKKEERQQALEQAKAGGPKPGLRPGRKRGTREKPEKHVTNILEVTSPLRRSWPAPAFGHRPIERRDPMAIKTYKDGTPFTGVIGRTTEESSPAWPEPPRPPEGAPNVLFFVLDDVGYGQLSSFGGLVETPVLDSLAANGLRYTNMHTTALCSPSRGCILTGRNHHSIGLASITETSTGYPGYNGILPFDRGMLSEMLLQQGYNTFCVGKWHLTPPEHTTAAGPYDRWPLGRGFERYYGFLGGETNQWYPELTYDNHEVEQPKQPEEGYHLSIDLADKAIEFIQDAHVNAPDKPFFLYYATGAGHAPHHVPKEWADKYKGKFDMGWDEYREIVHQRQLEMGIIPPGTELSAHDPDVPVWDTLPDDAKRLYARIMEVYAGFISFTDYHFGRILEFLREIGELDNTLIMVISDNGASSEGGPVGSLNEMFFFNNVKESLEDNLKMIDKLGGVETLNHYPWGWTNAGNTPFRRWKRETYRGGTTDPCIVSWPKGIQARGEMRPHYGHIIDFVPTVLEALGIEAPESIRGVTQAPIDGISFAHTFNDAAAPSNHHTQYFEMFGHRSIYHDGWRAVCPWPGTELHRGRQEGPPVRLAHSQPGAGGYRDPRLGAVPHRRGLLRNPQPGRRAPRQADRNDRPLVGRSGQVQRAARSTATSAAASTWSARPSPSRGTRSSFTRAGRRSPLPPRPSCTTGPGASRPTS